MNFKKAKGGQRIFPESFKRNVVRQVLTGEAKAADLGKKYGITDAVISGWKRNPKYAVPTNSNGDHEPVARPIAGPPSTHKGLRARVEVLERALGKQLVEEYLRKQGV